jgi:carbonic anhydrase
VPTSNPPKTGAAALQTLLEGNARFASGNPTCRPDIERVRELVSGQSPFATVLGCADSRVPVETLFDHEPGDIFVVRLAGNFVSDAALGSIEYAVEVLKSPLVMVLGHTGCGAVRAAIDAIESGQRFPGNIELLAAAIRPAAQACRSAGGDWWSNAVAENVRRSVERLRGAAPILSQAAQRGAVLIAGGVYDLSSGLVRVV